MRQILQLHISISFVSGAHILSLGARTTREPSCQLTAREIVHRLLAHHHAAHVRHVHDHRVEERAVRRQHQHSGLIAARLPADHAHMHAAGQIGQSPEAADHVLQGPVCVLCLVCLFVEYASYLARKSVLCAALNCEFP